MEQSISLKIAGRDYPLKASSAEMEQLMRIAAEDINRKLAAYEVKYPDKTTADKLAFVALNETMGKLAYQKAVANLEKEAETLLSDTSAYLDNIEKNSR